MPPVTTSSALALATASIAEPPTTILVSLTSPGGARKEAEWNEIMSFWRQCARHVLKSDQLVTERLSWRSDMPLFANRTIAGGLVADAWQEVKLAYWDDLLSLLSTGVAVLKADADSFFVRDPLPLMRRSSADIVACSTCESWVASAGSVCTSREWRLPGTTTTVEETFRSMGFMLNSGMLHARPTPRVLRFLTRAKAKQREAFASGAKVVSDQAALNQMLHLFYNCSWASAEGRPVGGEAARRHLGLYATTEAPPPLSSASARSRVLRGRQASGAQGASAGADRGAASGADRGGDRGGASPPRTWRSQQLLQREQQRELARRSLEATSLYATCEDGLTVEALPYSRCPRHVAAWSAAHALVLHPGGQPQSKLKVIRLLRERGVCGDQGSTSLRGTWRHIENRVGSHFARAFG